MSTLEDLGMNIDITDYERSTFSKNIMDFIKICNIVEQREMPDKNNSALDGFKEMVLFLRGLDRNKFEPIALDYMNNHADDYFVQKFFTLPELLEVMYKYGTSESNTNDTEDYAEKKEEEEDDDLAFGYNPGLDKINGVITPPVTENSGVALNRILSPIVRNKQKAKESNEKDEKDQKILDRGSSDEILRELFGKDWDRFYQ